MLLARSNILEQESKRLGFQVEKVLQMAVFDTRRAQYHPDGPTVEGGKPIGDGHPPQNGLAVFISFEEHPDMIFLQNK